MAANIQMIIGDTNIKNQVESNNETSVAASSLTDLLVFNTIKYERKSTTHSRHNLDREAALPLFVGLLIHGMTRKRDLVDSMYQCGLSVSYDRVLKVSTDEANRVIAIYEKDGVVCPPILQKGVIYNLQLG